MLVQIKDDDTLSFFLDETAGFLFLEVYVETQQIQPEATPQNYQHGGYMANPEMSQQWGEYMSLLANEGLPSSCNPDFGTGTYNPDFGAGTFNVDFGAGTSNYSADDYYPSMVAVTSGLKNIAIYHSELSQSQIHVSENFTPHQDAAVDSILDTFGNISDASSEPDEVDYPIPPEDGPNDVDINIMAENFAQCMSSSPEPVQTNRTTPQSFYRSMPFFDQTFPEIPADSIDVPIMKYAKFYNKNKGKLDVGMLFKNKVELIEAVKDHSIRHARREYYVTESSKTKWKVVCLHSTQVQQNPSYGIKHVIQTVKDHTGYDIPYQKAWYSLKMAREIVYGTWESSVQKLPKYMGALKKVLPLAFAIVDDESTSSWKWFLTLLSRHVIRGRRGVCLISNRHPDIIKAVRECSDFVSPHGAHRYCLRHVCSNFNTHYKNVILKDLCWRAGSEYQIRKFNRIMEEIKSQNIVAFQFLDKINKEKWTASHDGGWRTGILTTNMPECINGVLKGARRLPLTAIVEITLVRTVNYFCDEGERESCNGRQRPTLDGFCI
ncbi:UNVERIFIED_CONTAM: hypothetical protein Sradi_2972100 [Sesamum radiatum]|uniref:MULE transposase domain-containing protein n=1 Tax=Sesamum radiatum TaxID=300843 RepID=A0AAW2S0B0_SESRA